jgi:hypothetical protein
LLNRLTGARVTCDPELPFQRLQIPRYVGSIYHHQLSGINSHVNIIGGTYAHVKCFCKDLSFEAKKNETEDPGGYGLQ